MGHAQNKREAIEKTELLLQFNREGVTISEIAAHIGCDPSTAHRYLKEIEQQRELIEVKRGHYRLDPTQSLHNVRLHPSEALSIYVALRRLIRQTSKAPDFMISAIQKIAPALQRPDLVALLQDSVIQLHEERKMSSRDTGVWRTLVQGWLENRVVRIRYQKPKDGGISEHEIEPYWFEPAPLSDGVYLIAWSRTRKAMRTFKPDRFLSAALTQQDYQRHPNLNLLDLLRHAWGIWYGEETVQIELLFVPQVAGRVLETIYHPTEQKRLMDDGSLYWTAELSGMLEILSWVRGWGPEVKVLAPDSLREAIQSDLRRTMALYEGG